MDTNRATLNTQEITEAKYDGRVFRIGTRVWHQSEGDETAVIESFYWREETLDIIAVTDLGESALPFLLYEFEDARLENKCV